MVYSSDWNIPSWGFFPLKLLQIHVIHLHLFMTLSLQIENLFKIIKFQIIWIQKNHRLYNNAMQLLSYIKRYETFTIWMPILSSSCVLYKTTSVLPSSAAIISPFDLPGHTGGPRSFKQWLCWETFASNKSITGNTGSMHGKYIFEISIWNVRQ